MSKWIAVIMAIAGVLAYGCMSGADRVSVNTVGKGEVKLFNGKDLTGWTFSDPTMAGTWTVRGGVMVDSGKPRGYIRTEADYKNFVLRMKVRHVTEGNGGVLLRAIGKDKIWPKCVEAQGMYANMGDIYNIGEFNMQTDPARTEGRRTVKMHPSNEKPLGEWNDYEIRMDKGRMEIRVNGLLQNTADDVDEVAGKICFQSEGAQMEFKDIVLQELP